MRWTDARLLAALEMRARGIPAAGIAEAFRVSTAEVEARLAAVDRDLAAAGKPRRRSPRLGETVDPAAFRAAFERAWPGHGGRVRAAKHYGVTRRTVTRWLSGTTTVPPEVVREIEEVTS